MVVKPLFCPAEVKVIMKFHLSDYCYYWIYILRSLLLVVMDWTLRFTYIYTGQ